MRSNAPTWRTPPHSTRSIEAAPSSRRGIAAHVAGLSHADELLAEAVAADPNFFLARVGAAAANVVAGQPYAAPVRTPGILRGEAQHGEIVEAAFAGDPRRATELRREHLLEYPGDLLIVWLPAVQRPQG